MAYDIGVERTSCCGIYELDGVSILYDEEIPRSFLAALHSEFNNLGNEWLWPAFVVFTDARSPRQRTLSGGEKFAKFLTTHNLGEITSTSWRRNPNSGNRIKQWTWAPNARAINKLLNQ